MASAPRPPLLSAGRGDGGGSRGPDAPRGGDLMPRHVNPTTPDRTATAPYNFVPLPNQIFTVDEGIPVDGVKIKPWECHDRFVPGTHSGWIECTIELLTPLYVRGAVVQRAGQHGDSRDARLRPDPYCTPDGRPAIPGSSLRAWYALWSRSSPLPRFSR